jgi:hypothetical protein
MLAVLWAGSIVVFGLGGLFAVFKMIPIGIIAAPVLVIVAAVMAYGLLMCARWARMAQIVISGIGLFTPFLLPSAAVLVYMLRGDVAAIFSARDEEELEMLESGRPELAYAAVIALALLVTVVGIAIAGAMLATRQ